MTEPATQTPLLVVNPRSGGGKTGKIFDAVSGGVAGQVSLGKRVDACLVQADAFTVPAAPNPIPLGEQLARGIASVALFHCGKVGLELTKPDRGDGS